MIPLAACADERLESLPDIPTFLEAGVDIAHQQSRGVVMNAGVDPAAIKYYSDLMEKVSATDEWKQFLKDNTMQEAYMNSEEYAKFNVELADNYKEFLTIVLAEQ